VYPTRDIIADFYMAMASAGAGKREDAQAALAAGIHLWQTTAPTPRSGDLEFFEDWILCSLARDEAKKAVASMSTERAHSDSKPQ
jgi:hypothetical protein